MDRNPMECLVHEQLPGMTTFHDALGEGVCVDTSKFVSGRTGIPYYETAVVGPAGDRLVEQHEWTVCAGGHETPAQHCRMIVLVLRRIERARVSA